MTPASHQSPHFEAVSELTERFVMATYARRPVAFVRGKNARLWDTEGREYIDLLSGLAVCVLGHAHPRLTRAIRAQAGALLHTSNLYHIPPQARLAEKLAQLSGGMQSFFCNSGAEAMEAALKLARKWAKHHRGIADPEIVCAYNSFHGRTFGALTVTGQPKYQKDFEPLLQGIRYAEFNNLEQFCGGCSERTAAVVLEVIQGEGGVIPATPQFLQAVADLCDNQQVLLILDEVQTGLGRTGTFFAYQHYGITPHIVTLAKGLAGGVPIGALLAQPRVARVFQPGDHASTFGGNFLASAAALATLEVIEEQRLPERAARLGRRIEARLDRLIAAAGLVVGRRGRGLMQALQLARPVAKAVEEQCLARRLLVNAVRDDTIRILPPLTIPVKDLDEGLDILEQAILAVTKEA